MSVESFLAKLKKLEEYTFLLPSLQEEIKYKKLDVIEASINGTMPNFIASKVLEVMKSGLKGDQVSSDVPTDVNNDDVKDILIKATEMWERCVIEPKLSMEQIVQIPSEDRIAWFMDAVTNSYSSRTTSGGEVGATDVANFPDGRTRKRNSKRSADSEVL